MKKRKIIKIIVSVLIVIAVISVIWLNSERPELKLNEHDIPLGESFIVRKGKVPHQQGIHFLLPEYTSVRVEFDLGSNEGNIEKIILTRNSDNKTVSVDIKPRETKATLELGEVKESVTWLISVVCSEDAEAKVTYDVYAKEKWITAIKKYRGGNKHHL